MVDQSEHYLNHLQVTKEYMTAITIDSPKTNLDNTVRIFDNFYNFTVSAGAGEYDIVSSYFISVCKNTAVANNFTAFLFRIASLTEISVLTLLDEIKGTAQNSLQVNAIIAYYLNSFKSKTSLYGVSTLPQPNESVQRNIIV